MRSESILDAIIGFLRMSVGGLYKEGNMNGLIFGIFDIGFILFLCGWHNVDLNILYHLGGLRNLAHGKRWNKRSNGRKDEQLVVSNCSKKRREYFLREGAILKY